VLPAADWELALFFQIGWQPSLREGWLERASSRRPAIGFVFRNKSKKSPAKYELLTLFLLFFVNLCEFLCIFENF